MEAVPGFAEFSVLDKCGRTYQQRRGGCLCRFPEPFRQFRVLVSAAVLVKTEDVGNRRMHAKAV